MDRSKPPSFVMDTPWRLVVETEKAAKRPRETGMDHRQW
jgi:hypothetical protein